MITMTEINSEIESLENQPASFATIQKLSWLYTVRDHMTQTVPHGDSDFRRACAGKKLCDVMDIVDELMTVLLAVQPRLYHAVMDKL